MAAQLFANNASSALAAGITSAATSLTLVAGQGALFPLISGADYFILTLTQAASESSWEIVKVTARTADTLTIVRAQEGTTAAAWATGAKAELRVTAAVLNPAVSGGANGLLLGSDKAKLDATSNTNTGDETLATIKTKLGISTLSGSNTGDQVLPTTLPASDVYAWAKAATKPTYTASDVGLGSVDNTADSAKSVNYATTAGNGGVTSVNGSTGAVTVAAAEPTTEQVLTATAGAAAGAIGSYAFLQRAAMNANTVFGTSYAGNVLYVTGANASLSVSTGYTRALTATAGDAVSGTWMALCKGSAVNGLGTAGLFLRIA